MCKKTDFSFFFFIKAKEKNKSPSLERRGLDALAYVTLKNKAPRGVGKHGGLRKAREHQESNMKPVRQDT